MDIDDDSERDFHLSSRARYERGYRRSLHDARDEALSLRNGPTTIVHRRALKAAVSAVSSAIDEIRQVATATLRAERPRRDVEFSSWYTERVKALQSEAPALGWTMRARNVMLHGNGVQDPIGYTFVTGAYFGPAVTDDAEILSLASRNLSDLSMPSEYELSADDSGFGLRDGAEIPVATGWEGLAPGTWAVHTVEIKNSPPGLERHDLTELLDLACGAVDQLAAEVQDRYRLDLQ